MADEKKPGAVENFLMPYLDKVLDRVTPILTAKLDEFKTAALDELKEQVPILLDKVIAMLPLLAATVGQEVTNKIVGIFAKVLKIDPDVPVLSNIFDLSETVRGVLNAETPDEIHIPTLADVFKGLTGR
jgi:hypothetical protein